jgi:hypothetical protein
MKTGQHDGIPSQPSMKRGRRLILFVQQLKALFKGGHCMNWLFLMRRPAEGRPVIVDLWSANTKLAPNRHVGDYSREVGLQVAIPNSEAISTTTVAMGV